jgi:hypothetical protein
VGCSWFLRSWPPNQSCSCMREMLHHFHASTAVSHPELRVALQASASPTAAGVCSSWLRCMGTPAMCCCLRYGHAAG